MHAVGIFGASPLPFSIPPELKGQFLVGDFIWADPRGAAAALLDAEQAIRQAQTAMSGKVKAEQE